MPHKQHHCASLCVLHRGPSSYTSRYDLSSLMQSHANYQFSTEDYFYEVNICRPLVPVWGKLTMCSRRCFSAAAERKEAFKKSIILTQDFLPSV